MKKRLLSVILAAMTTVSLAACGSGPSGDTASGKTADGGSATEEGKDAGDTDAGSTDAEGSSELVDGKFPETHHISVEIYDRGNDGGSDPTNNSYTKWIQQQMLEQHNVEVEFIKVPRWTEVDDINNLLAAGTAPDVCVTYSYPTIQTYADMGGVVDMGPLLETYKNDLPNLWGWLGEENLYWDQDPTEGTVWGIEAKLAQNRRLCTFIRKDWLDKLNLKEPTTKDEFYNCIKAFKDNASDLLGAEADKMVPFSVSFDVGWRAGSLIESFIDPKMTDKERYINGFDDRELTQNGTKEAVKLLNKWYNEGLMWNDFALYGSGDSTEDDMMKAGYVGAFTHNWDYPFRNGDDSIEANLKRMVGDDAKFVAIDPFEDMNGTHTKWLAPPIDRKIFFPATNDEPLASMLYLDFISDPATIEYLQIGEEGVTHNTDKETGAVTILAATGDDIQNSGLNIDYTITCNGLKLQDPELTELSLAYTYAGIDPQLVIDAAKISTTDARYGVCVKTGAIASETTVGDTLSAKRDQIYDNCVSCKEADFDSTWDSMYNDYLSSGGQAIMDERAAAWEAAYPGVDMVK